MSVLIFLTFMKNVYEVQHINIVFVHPKQPPGLV